jgi:hypothetical protein
MLEIYEIIEPAVQGQTTPFLCKASDNKNYYVKGQAATATGLMKEFIAGSLAHKLGLPIPAFHIAYLDEVLAKAHSQTALECLGSGYVFASECIDSVTEFKYEMLKQVNPSLQTEVLLFDLWVQNEDRALTDKGGNPNLLWQSGQSKLHIIDHNLAFDPDFNLKLFWETHAFRLQFNDYQLDSLEKQRIESRLQESLKSWVECWGKIPIEWKEDNEETKFFNFETTLNRLSEEAQGTIWSKLL